MSPWSTTATVACVIAREGKYLLVEEHDKTTGELVFNQPAGHLEADESLLEAALRETCEETGWRIELSGIISVALYKPPASDNTYYRMTFVAQAIEPVEGAVLDPDIHAVHWLGYEEIVALSARMRSPLVLASIERHRRGICFPLDLIDTP